MRGIKRRIEAIIEEVNHVIRVDLGLEELNPELITPDTLDVADELPEINTEEESEEAKAFGKLLDEICQRYENQRTEIDEEYEDWEEAPLDDEHIY